MNNLQFQLVIIHNLHLAVIWTDAIYVGLICTASLHQLSLLRVYNNNRSRNSCWITRVQDCFL